eukprot:m.1637712 g.1637712  ORF g.1637712 m.1637712 type:complete len:304 (-) comp26088_c0_seq1:204-1115(-)
MADDMARSTSYLDVVGATSEETNVDSTAVAIPPQQTTDLKRTAAAQDAFKSGDPDASRFVHDNVAKEEHDSAGDYVKVMVFGGLDGIITTFAVVASIAGADLKTEVVLVMGFANLLADAVSMAFGEYISGDAEQRYVKHERDREAWELENYKDGEVKEMIDLYVEKGFSKEDASKIIELMATNKTFFIDHMLVEELGMLPPDDDLKGIIMNSLVMFTAFVVFGLVPLLAYLAFSTFLSKGSLFAISCVLTALALFGLGAFSSKFSSSTWYRGGFFVLLNGATAAGVAYLVGYVLTQIVDVGDC